MKFKDENARTRQSLLQKENVTCPLRQGKKYINNDPIL